MQVGSTIYSIFWTNMTHIAASLWVVKAKNKCSIVLKTATSCIQTHLSLVIKLIVDFLYFSQDLSVMLLALEQEKESCSRSDLSLSHACNNNLVHLRAPQAASRE